MDFESYSAKKRALDKQISEKKMEIQKIKDQIDDAQIACEGAKKLRLEFDDFVTRRRNAMSRTTKRNNAKSFMSFLEKATSVLSGRDYWQACEQADEMSRLINQKLRQYDEDLDFCKKELRRLIDKKEALEAEYRAAVLASSEEV